MRFWRGDYYDGFEGFEFPQFIHPASKKNFNQFDYRKSLLELFGLNLWIELKLLKKPTLYENIRNNFGAITLPLRESRRANLLAMRRGVLF